MSLPKIHILYCIRRYISTSAVNYKGTYLKREGKFIKKMIYGEIPKKKWFPAKDSRAAAVINTTAVNVTKPHVTRRVTIRNKLFMKHITDLMATGEIATSILGRGIEISRVNITNDSKLVKVFWFSTTSNVDDLREVTNILKDCAYKLRHELSQLKVIGVVPPIQFFKDRQLENAVEFEKKLSTADYGDDYTPTIKIPSQPQLTLFTKLPDDIREKIVNLEKNEELDEENPAIYNVDLPSMKHDVLGLDHWKIMMNVKQSLRKSEEAAANRLKNLSTEEKQQPFVPPQFDTFRTDEEAAAFNAFLLNRRIEEKKRQQRVKEVDAYELGIDTQLANEEDDYHLLNQTDIDSLCHNDDDDDDDNDNDDIHVVN